MAEQLDTYRFQRGGFVAYDWDNWLNGGIWRIVKGEDFNIAPRSMQSQVYDAAKARGLKAHVQVEPGDSLVLQAFSPNGDGHAA